MASADSAIAYVLRRIQSDPRIAYYFAHTEALERLCKAHTEATGDNAEDFKRAFEQSLRTEPPRCRPSECAKAGGQP